jgi:hypothetical protein
MYMYVCDARGVYFSDTEGRKTEARVVEGERKRETIFPRRPVIVSRPYLDMEHRLERCKCMCKVHSHRNFSLPFVPISDCTVSSRRFAHPATSSQLTSARAPEPHYHILSTPVLPSNFRGWCPFWSLVIRLLFPPKKLTKAPIGPLEMGSTGTTVD